MYSYYLQKGHTLKELCNLTPIEREFYMASMIIWHNKDYKDKEYFAKLSNPMYKKGD